MFSHKSLKLLLTSVLVALLSLAPGTAAAQRRNRSRAPRRANAPSAQPTKPNVQARQTTRPAPTPAPVKEEKEDFEAERVFEEVVPGDGYALVIEMRRVGQFVRSKEVKELLDVVHLVGGDVKELTEAIDFFTSNAEQLADVHAYSVTLPTRPGLPEFVAAYQFKSVEAARAFEPKVSGILDKYQKSLKGAQVSPGAKTGEPGRAEPKSDSPSNVPPAAPGLSLAVKRYGNLILMSGGEFTLKKLKPEGEQSLAGNARFQSLRSRLSTEPLFLYFDIALMGKSTQLMRESYEKQQAGLTETEHQELDKETQAEIARIEAEAEAAAQSSPPPAGPPAAVVAEAPPPPAAAATVTEGDPRASEPKSDEEETARSQAVLAAQSGEMFMGLIFGSFMGGAARWPEAVGAALALDGDSFVVRALVVNPAGDRVQPVPFIPTLISGPLLTPQAASVAPADTDVFITASLDLSQIYNRVILSMDDNTARMRRASMETGETPAAEKPAAEAESGTEKTIAAAEKLLGFKIKEDFIPAVGNEVAVQIPLKWFTGDYRYNEGRGSARNEQGKEPVILISLNNAEAVQKMLPRILELAGLKSITAPEQTTNHAGVEIKTYGALSAAYMGNFLALSWDAASIKRVAEAASSQGVLSGDERFRAATSWQPRMKLAEAYVSRALMDNMLKEYMKWTDPNDPEVQQLLARLNVRPQAASYAVTNEGGGELLHELRLPTSAVKFFALDAKLDRKIAPIRGGEGAALTTLLHIRNTQDDFKRVRGKGSYASFEELLPRPKPKEQIKEGEEDYEYKFSPLNGQALERLGYNLALSAAGDKYTVVATPKEYGKTGRRSFFMDETGIIRGADRNGEPATSDDPPID